MKAALLLLGLAAAMPSTARAEDQGAVFRPGLGDLMTMSVQPRHTKLGLAGQQKNWAYAEYEAGELQEALDDVAESTPVWDGFAVAEGIRGLTKEPLAAVVAAIKAADGARFAKAYVALTAACNQCHQSAGKGVIVIQVPGTSPYPDQDFRAVKP